MNEFKDDPYYININCSELQHKCTIDADYRGWILLTEALQHHLNEQEDEVVCSQEIGGILTEFQAGDTYQSIKKINFKLLHIPTDADEVQFTYDKQNAILTLHASNNGYIELLSTFKEFSDYGIKGPTDVILMPQDYGGQGLSVSMVPVKSDEVLIEIVKLTRWH